MILCPKCQQKAMARAGGGTGITRYYTCRECDINFAYTNGQARIMDDGPELPYRNGREARHCLYQAARDDRIWFGAMTEETEELARLVLREYIIKNRSKPGAKLANQISFGFSRRQGKRAA